MLQQETEAGQVLFGNRPVKGRHALFASRIHPRTLRQQSLCTFQLAATDGSDELGLRSIREITISLHSVEFLQGTLRVRRGTGAEGGCNKYRRQEQATRFDDHAIHGNHITG